MEWEVSPEEAIRDLLELLDLEEIDVNIYRGTNEKRRPGRLFGGQVAAQALAAAGETVDDTPAHSLHGYFLRPGDPAVPVVYTVDRIRDGRSFTTRRVVAQQHGKAIFNMAASFHKAEPGYFHQQEMPAVPPPEDLLSRTEAVYLLEAVQDNEGSEFHRRGLITLAPSPPAAALGLTTHRRMRQHS